MIYNACLTKCLRSTVLLSSPADQLQKVKMVFYYSCRLCNPGSHPELLYIYSYNFLTQLEPLHLPNRSYSSSFIHRRVIFCFILIGLECWMYVNVL